MILLSFFKIHSICSRVGKRYCLDRKLISLTIPIVFKKGKHFSCYIILNKRDLSIYVLDNKKQCLYFIQSRNIYKLRNYRILFLSGPRIQIQLNLKNLDPPYWNCKLITGGSTVIPTVYSGCLAVSTQTKDFYRDSNNNISSNNRIISKRITILCIHHVCVLRSFFKIIFCHQGRYFLWVWFSPGRSPDKTERILLRQTANKTMIGGFWLIWAEKGWDGVGSGGKHDIYRSC